MEVRAVALVAVPFNVSAVIVVSSIEIPEPVVPIYTLPPAELIYNVLPDVVIVPTFVSSAVILSEWLV